MSLLLSFAFQKLIKSLELDSVVRVHKPEIFENIFYFKNIFITPFYNVLYIYLFCIWTCQDLVMPQRLGKVHYVTHTVLIIWYTFYSLYIVAAFVPDCVWSFLIFWMCWIFWGLNIKTIIRSVTNLWFGLFPAKRTKLAVWWFAWTGWPGLESNSWPSVHLCFTVLSQVQEYFNSDTICTCTLPKLI